MSAATTPLDAVDRAIVNSLQSGLPLTPRPYADAALALGLEEGDLIARIRSLLDRGILTRFGPLFQIERAGGLFVLCACHVEEARFDTVAATINARPEVAHNYAREHWLNMWFVLGIEHASDLPETLAQLEREAGVEIFAFPKEREFFVNLYLRA